MADNPLSGHTAGSNDGLRDGDHILSPSLTNLYEGVHSNGILSAHGTAYGDSNRNTPAQLAGAISSSAAHQITVESCSYVLDGVLYTIADTTISLTSGSSSKIGSTTALSSGKECLFVIVLTSKSPYVMFAQATPVTTATGVYASISGTAASYLKDGVGTNNKQCIVIGTVRATYNGSAAGANDLNLTQSERNDKRVFIRPTPMYFSPVTSGAVAATTEVATHTALAQVHGSGEYGDFGSTGVLWQSFGGQIGSTTAGDNDKDVLYYSATHAARFTRSVFDRVLTSTATSIDLTASDANILVLTPGGSFAVTTSGPFPAGYVIEIKNTHGSNTGTFALTNSTTSTIGDTADPDGGYARFVCTVSHATGPTFVRLI